METFGKCPQCGKGEMIRGTIGYLCNHCKSIDDSCKFIIFREYFGKEITPAILGDLLNKGKTDVFHDLKKKDGGTFTASLVLEDLKVKLCFDAVYLENVLCPKCGGKIVETGNAFMCEGYRSENPCPVYISRKIAETKIGRSDAVAILSGKATDMMQFVSGSGKNFTARLLLDRDFKVVFDRVICKCPKCGGNIYGGDRAYGCSNYNAAEKCTFTVWREIYSKTITPPVIIELCTKGETKIMQGFKTKDGRPVERKLALSNDFQVMVI